MGNSVSLTLQVTVNDGKADEAKALMTELVAVSQAEPGTTDYDWYVGDDGKTVHIFERYTDSDAALAHLGGFGANFAERFMGCFTPTSVCAYGNASDAVRGALKAFGTQHFSSYGGFQR